MSSLRTNKLATYMTRNGLIAIYFVCLLIGGAGRAHAQDGGKRLTQYRHSMWRIQDGFFPGAPDWVSQTADGYLWVGTWSGTFRFDGVRFVPWSPPAAASNDTYLFVPAKSGGFWINDNLGLSHIRGNRIVSHINLEAAPGRLVEEEDGSLWVTTWFRPGSLGSLCHATDREVRCFGKADGNPIQTALPILSDGTGGFWIGSDTTLLHWKAGASEVYEPPALRSNSGQTGISSLIRNPDGSLWVGIAAAGRGLGLERFRNGTFESFSAPNFDDTEISVLALLRARDGSLWVGTANNGLYRIHTNTVDHFGLADGLSSNSVNNLYEDQEGIIWAATSNGIDSFQEPRVTTYSAREGLGADNAVSVIVSHDGTVWVANYRSLDSIRNGVVLSVGKKDGLPGNQVTSLLEDRERHLWVGVDDGLYIYENRHFRPVADRNRSPLGMVVGMTEDIDGSIWAECASKPRKLVRIRDFRVQEEFLDSQVPAGHSLAADPSGGIWLGTVDGKLVSFRKSATDTFPMNLKGDLAVRQIEVLQDGSVIAAAIADGLISLRAGVVQRLTKQNGLPCDGVFGFTRDDRQNWWLTTPCGYVELADSEIQKWRNNPKSELRFRFLNTLDGARTGATPFNSAAKSPDGRLWFVGALVVQTIDPSRLAKESSVRPVYVESVTADRVQYAAENSLRLPALAQDIQIDYTSPSLAVPKKVKFRYRLDGSDSNWQDAGTRRQAFYTNLRPGQYRFTIIASNEDGIWNMPGATLQFGVAPAWFQTIWFRTLCVVAFFLSLWCLYQMRLRQVRHQFHVSLEARVSERTRIARELHDTLLQSFQGLMLRFQTVEEMLPARPMDAKKALEGALVRADQAIAEGRDAITDIRTSTLESHDLAKSMTALMTGLNEELAEGNGGSATFRVLVEGAPRAVRPILHDEVYRIARESLRNAFRHAQARNIETEITYGESLRLRFRDDGKGIDPNVVESGGRSGHWGLPGIRERANKIGAQLQVWSELGAGTEVELSIPGSVAYEGPATRTGLQLFRKRTEQNREHRS
jgi:signal transduction histidine kinase/ligand-binding sensor domain-containing protein